MNIHTNKTVEILLKHFNLSIDELNLNNEQSMTRFVNECTDKIYEWQCNFNYPDYQPDRTKTYNSVMSYIKSY